MNKILVLASVAILVFWILFLNVNFKKSTYNLQEYVIEKEKIIPTKIELNSNDIQEFYAEDVKIDFSSKPMFWKFTGTIAYQKENNFRLLIRSLFSQEIDIGMNEDRLWYWSKRDKNPALYWANVEQFHLTNLKTPFDPFFFKASLGLEVIDNENYDIFEYENMILAQQQRTNGLNQKVTYTLVFDKDQKKFKGVKITDSENKLLAESIYKEQERFVPFQITYRWYEEDRWMVLSFTDTANKVKKGQKFFDIFSNKIRNRAYINMVN